MNIEGDKMDRALDEEKKQPVKEVIVHIPIEQFSNSEDLKKELSKVIDIDFNLYQKYREKAKKIVKKSMSKMKVPVKGNIQKVIQDEELDMHWGRGVVLGLLPVIGVVVAVCKLTFIKFPNESMKLQRQQFSQDNSLHDSMLMSSKDLEAKYDKALENLGIKVEDNFENREEQNHSSRR